MNFPHFGVFEGIVISSVIFGGMPPFLENRGEHLHFFVINPPLEKEQERKVRLKSVEDERIGVT